MLPVQWARWLVLQKFKPLDLEAHHSSPVSGEVKDVWSLTTGITSPVNVCIDYTDFEIDTEDRLRRYEWQLLV
jgi:hypothetical protein